MQHNHRKTTELSHMHNMITSVLSVLSDSCRQWRWHVLISRQTSLNTQAAISLFTRTLLHWCFFVWVLIVSPVVLFGCFLAPFVFVSSARWVKQDLQLRETERENGPFPVKLSLHSVMLRKNTIIGERLAKTEGRGGDRATRRMLNRDVAVTMVNCPSRAENKQSC